MRSFTGMVTHIAARLNISARQMPVILLAIFIDLVGFGMILPILPFIALTYGGDSLTIAGIMSIYALTAFTIGPVCGVFQGEW